MLFDQQKELESRNRRNNYDDHDPQMEGVGLMGNSIRVESQTRVRPLAGMNFKKAEETAKVSVSSLFLGFLYYLEKYFDLFAFR